LSQHRPARAPVDGSGTIHDPFLSLRQIHCFYNFCSPDSKASSSPPSRISLAIKHLCSELTSSSSGLIGASVVLLFFPSRCALLERGLCAHPNLSCRTIFSPSPHSVHPNPLPPKQIFWASAISPVLWARALLGLLECGHVCSLPPPCGPPFCSFSKIWSHPLLSPRRPDLVWLIRYWKTARQILLLLCRAFFLFQGVFSVFSCL